MARPARLPDLIAGIDPVELQLMVLAIVEERGFGAEYRQKFIQSRGEFIDLVNNAGGAENVIKEAVRRLRA
jgi:phosphosulfolactate synthase (CoM biosynthesis protein A)